MLAEAGIREKPSFMDFRFRGNDAEWRFGDVPQTIQPGHPAATIVPDCFSAREGLPPLDAGMPFIVGGKTVYLPELKN